MQKDDFILMSLEERAEFLWQYAEHITQMAYYECDISLFLLGNYYVEVFLNRDQKLVVSIEVQENDQILYGYVKNLDIRELEKLLQ